MAASGAQPGNQNAAKGKVWVDAINRALGRRAGDRIKALDDCADKLIDAVLAGEQWAIIELGNRMDGKPAQSLTIGGDAENPLHTNVTRIPLVPLRAVAK